MNCRDVKDNERGQHCCDSCHEDIYYGYPLPDVDTPDL